MVIFVTIIFITNKVGAMKKISTELNHADLIKYAFFKDYHLPKELSIINLTQERILMTIKNSVNLSMVSISRSIGLEKGPFSQSVDKLVDLGLVERVRSESDRRLIHLNLTDKGVDLANQVEESMEQHFALRRDLLTTEQLEELFTALASLNKIAQIIISK